ncbi:MULTISPECIES: hypothetical protein [unclassified Pseudoalteromonas]|uniref:ORC-CDC6 family AAA ATPase n=1 Tax=unclassified Pseudoalteromonas TaxID=194690 RepID=UPI0006949236|nr:MULTISPECIES: hypothetical protein [unclassified Pseudoalteromonas]
MRPVNSILMRLAKRAEKLQPDHLKKSFVDVGPTYTLLSSTDNQIMFGRRGTGKTHFLTVLSKDILDRGLISVPIDMRLIGSTGGIFADKDIPQSERATRLLSDTLCLIHENILDYIFDNELQNASEITELLNEFVEQATSLCIDGVSESEVSSTNKLSINSENKVGITTKSLSVGLSSKETIAADDMERGKVTGKKVLRIHFGAITKLLNKIVRKLPGKELWVLIDEWSETPLDLQPYLAELLRRILYPIPGITVKIAAIAHRCNFKEYDYESNVSIGIELGSDASSVINLDEYMVFDNDSDAAKDFFKNLLHRHAIALDKTAVCENESNFFINDIFSQVPAFEEFVRAAEGVPRDAINIISLAAQAANDTKISISSVRSSAQKWFQVNKHNALNSRPSAVALLDRIINEVIGLRKSRGFLISNEKSFDLIDYLYDMRIIHVLKQGVSAHNSVGKKYTIYALDYGCYVDLMSSSNAPKGLIIESDENEEAHYIEIPKADYRSVKNSILDIEQLDSGQARFDLITSTDQLQLPKMKKNKSISLEKNINQNLLSKIPKDVGILKVDGSIYIPLIFVALVLRKAKGFDCSYSVELTNEINEIISLNMSRNKIASNNMSRELRKENILNLEWLTRLQNGRKPLFSLNDTWVKYWELYFEKEAPHW